MKMQKWTIAGTALTGLGVMVAVFSTIAGLKRANPVEAQPEPQTPQVDNSSRTTQTEMQSSVDNSKRSQSIQGNGNVQVGRDLNLNTNPLEKVPIQQLVENATNFYTGKGGSQNLSEAAKNLDEAVRRGDTKAITIKGVWLAEGVVYPKNEEEALRLWKQAARQGSAEAAFNIGEFYYGSLGGDKWRSQGPSVRFALQEPIHWFLKAAKLGHKNATKRLHQEWSTETIDMIREQYPGDLQELDKLLHEPAK